MPIPARFRAFRIHEENRLHRAGIQEVSLDELTAGELVVQVAYSSVNYKDALAGTGKGRILRRFPLVGGIDVAGHVVASSDARFREGDGVLCCGAWLSETRDGGYAQYARLEADSTVHLPAGLDLREAMILGTAGFTAGLALLRMQENHQRPEQGPIAVTGATGGVGMLAVDILTRAGYEVHAISGKPERAGFLQRVGARKVIDRHQLATGQRPLEAAIWGGAVDTVGGEMLAGLTRTTSPYGNIAVCGLAASHELSTTVMPLILRGVSLLGVATTTPPQAQRQAVWERLGGAWKPAHLDAICTRTVDLGGLADVFTGMLAGASFGRTLVQV
ncbi:MAG: YhdH/YhfP family quinone oxidoreductase [Proteobacteria bacterium]|nr:YhdH/YhfP family quinone oxidoreductase [Pseudomonadota bacterium]